MLRLRRGGLKGRLLCAGEGEQVENGFHGLGLLEKAVAGGGKGAGRQTGPLRLLYGDEQLAGLDGAALFDQHLLHGACHAGRCV